MRGKECLAAHTSKCTIGSVLLCTFILPVDGQYIFMADIWRPRHPRDARYIWLPIEFEDGKPVIRWRDAWDL